jgi:hypothetical protein
VGAFLFYMAYVGWASGTSFKIERIHGSPPRSSSGYEYGGADTRKDNPGKFWAGELAFLIGATVFVVSASKILWEEHKLQQHQKFLLTLPP